MFNRVAVYDQDVVPMLATGLFFETVPVPPASKPRQVGVPAMLPPHSKHSLNVVPVVPVVPVVVPVVVPASDPFDFTLLSGVGEARSKALRDAGLVTLSDLLLLTTQQLAERIDTTEPVAARILVAAMELEEKP